MADTNSGRGVTAPNATNPVVIEAMRATAYNSYSGTSYSRTVEVPFPQERMRAIASEIRGPLVYQTLRFERVRCVCDMHGTFYAALLPGEKPWCPRCIQDWLDEMRNVLFRLLACALAHLHRERMDAEHRALHISWLPDSMLYPNAKWAVLGENPSWNPRG